MAIRVLIVDDEDGVRGAIRRVLRDEGYEVGEAKTGEEAVGAFARDPGAYDIVLCDLVMPGIDGIETIREISVLCPEVTKIMLTAYGTLDAAVKAIDVGIDGFITKPFENKELVFRLKESYLKKKMGQLVSKHVFDRLLHEPSSLAPKVSLITVLFTDIRGFTRLSSTMKAEEIAFLLNRFYFSPLSDVVVRHSGTIDKYIGDSIMALFGAPLPLEDHARRAVLCAFEMMKVLKEVNPALKVGVGIGTGYVTAGLFGSRTKQEYTAFGMAVNVAARLQKLAGPGEILISEETKEGLDGLFESEEGGIIKVADQEVRYYTLTHD